MKNKSQAGPVGEKALRTLLQRGETFPLIALRLAFQESNQLLTHYIGPAAGWPSKDTKKEPWIFDGKAYPTMLPTQASLRWSTKRPPLPTFPPPYRHIARPYPGTVWAVWDYDAIEARIIAYESDDKDDINALERGWDLHTLTCCKIFIIKEPPDRIDPHRAESCAEWRDLYQWEGKDDRRRHLAKTCRYSLYYGKDEKPILLSKDVEKFGLDRQALLKIGRDYLRSKPALMRWKRRTWAKAWQDHETRTALGSRRRLIAGSWNRKAVADLEKAGLNHIIQGMVSLIMDKALIRICHPTLGRWPEAYLAYQSHDSGKVAFPVGVPWWPEIKTIVESPYVINGYTVPFPSTWHVITEYGHQCVSPWRPVSKCKDDRHVELTPEEYFQEAA